jgi:hypothetical protein
MPKTAPCSPPVRGGLLQRKCACGGTPGPTGECEGCRKKKLQRCSENLDPSSIIHPSSISEVPPIVHKVIRSPGQPLDPDTRATMEPHFGHDFSHVRLHVDPQAAESAREVDALAFTVGNHVVFGAGQYESQTLKGRRLLAHEFTHVIQQPRINVPPTSLSVGAVDDTHEHLANELAASLTNRANIVTASSAGVRLQRQLAGREGYPKGKPQLPYIPQTELPKGK